MDDLPPELFPNIFKTMNAQDLAAFSRTSKRNKELVYDHVMISLWKMTYQEIKTFAQGVDAEGREMIMQFMDYLYNQVPPDIIEFFMSLRHTKHNVNHMRDVVELIYYLNDYETFDLSGIDFRDDINDEGDVNIVKGNNRFSYVFGGDEYFIGYRRGDSEAQRRIDGPVSLEYSRGGILQGYIDENGHDITVRYGLPGFLYFKPAIRTYKEGDYTVEIVVSDDGSTYTRRVLDLDLAMQHLKYWPTGKPMPMLLDDERFP